MSTTHITTHPGLFDGVQDGIEALTAGFGLDSAVPALDPWSEVLQHLSAIASGYAELQAITDAAHPDAGALLGGATGLDAEAQAAMGGAAAQNGAALSIGGSLQHQGTGFREGESNGSVIETSGLAKPYYLDAWNEEPDEVESETDEYVDDGVEGTGGTYGDDNVLLIDEIDAVGHAIAIVVDEGDAAFDETTESIGGAGAVLDELGNSVEEEIVWDDDFGYGEEETGDTGEQPVDGEWVGVWEPGWDEVWPMDEQIITKLVFIDASLIGLEAMLAGYGPDTAIHFLDPAADGVWEMAAVASAYSSLDAIHVVSHGSSGTLHLGAARLDGASIGGYGEALAMLGAALADSGDLLLYGCDVAAGEFGQAFIDALALATGADIAASIDATGAAALGGDWLLEAEVGSIEASALAADVYDGLLQTFSGTSGNDNLYGTALQDYFYAYEGADYVYAYEGNDVAYGYDGNDSLYGAEGNDFLSGMGDNDYLNGGAGIDTMYGGLGNDTFDIDSLSDLVTEYLNEGTDWIYTGNISGYTLGANIERLYIYASSGTYYGYGNELANYLQGAGANNYFSGGTGNDSLYGYAGNDTLLGGNDNDYLYGGDGADSLNGGTQNDTLDGGTGVDNMNGGDGSDNYYVDDPGDVAAETYNDALGGVDTVYSYASYFYLGFGIEHLTLLNNASYTYRDAYGNENANYITANNGASYDYLTGYAGNDTLHGGNGGTGIDYMWGGLGNDYFYVDNASDGVYENLNEGTETVNSSASAYTLSANVENLILGSLAAYDGTGNDLANSITGNNNANYLNGGLGADIMVGGAGNDIYVVDNAGDSVTESGADTADWVYSSINYSLASIANVERLYIYGAAVSATGNTLNNYLLGSSAAETFDGQTGADTMDGNFGNDSYTVDNVADLVYEWDAAGGVDSVTSSVSYTLLAGHFVENLTLTGTALNATGNATHNVLTGTASANMLTGLAGNDTMIGLAGNDTYNVDNGADFVAESTGEGTDLVQISASSVNYTLNSEVENLTILATFTGVTAVGNSGVNTITGNEAANTLDGGAGVDTLIGLGGSDVYRVDVSGDIVNETAVGSAGDDTVESSSATGYTLSTNVENLTLIGTGSISGVGNSLANKLTGNSGSNTLTGGAGNDTVVGGGGLDRFILAGAQSEYTVSINGATGVVTVIDNNSTANGNDGTDVLTGIEVLEFLGGVTQDVVVHMLIDGSNGTPPASAGNDTLSTGFGNDTIDGLAGADSMTGYDGDDLYKVDNLGDSVVEAVNEGADTIWFSVNGDTLHDNVETGVLLNIGGVISLTGSAGDDALFGNTLANSLTGGLGNDTLRGNATLSGGIYVGASDAAVDTLVGGQGDDLYWVETATDVVTETLGNGNDTVRSTLSSYTLTANVENLVLFSAIVASGTGNSLDNGIVGNAANNTLDGAGGKDTMWGLAGNDSYLVDSVGDEVIEAAGEGTADTVTSTVNYTLGANVEHLILGGSANISGGGNADANSLTGNSGNNTLNGGAGVDTMAGGLGNDTYVLSDAAEVALVSDSGGTDTVRTSGFNLDLHSFSGIENITMFGTANLVAYGDAGANLIAGNLGDNVLYGYEGDDQLFGGKGDDWLFGYIGNDTLAGGLGTDTAGVEGASRDFAFSIDADGLVTMSDLNLTDGYGDLGTDLLDRIDWVYFYGDEAWFKLSAGSVGTEQHVGTSVVESNTSPEIAVLNGGGHVVTWEQGYTIYAQRYGSFGAPVGAAIAVTSLGSSEYSYYSDVTALSDGGFLVSYVGYSTGNSSYQLRARRYDDAGVLTQSLTLASSTGFVYEPALTALADGGYLATWTRYKLSDTPGVYSYDVQARLFDASNVALGAEFNVTTSTHYEYGSAVTALAGGGFVIAWYDSNSEATDGNADAKGIYAQRYDALGVADGVKTRLDGYADGDKAAYFSPTLVALQDGGYMAFWQASNGSDYDIYGRIVGPSGGFVEVNGIPQMAFRVNTTSSFSQETPNAVTLADGDVVVVWSSQRGGVEGRDIMGQRFDTFGNLLGGEFLVNSFTSGTQRSPDVAASDDGGFIVTWASEGTQNGVYAQRFNTEGGKVGGMRLEGTVAGDVLLVQGAEQSVELFGFGGNDTLTASDMDDQLDGGAGDDLLDGGAGADTMVGGAGDDQFFVDDAADAPVEQALQGYDTVFATVEYALPETAIERLVLSGAALAGHGNDHANTIAGNLGDNTLGGSGGDDSLLGGWGADQAVFQDLQAAYLFGLNASGVVTVRHVLNGGTGGTDELHAIEAVEFDGGGAGRVDILRADAVFGEFQLAGGGNTYTYNPQTAALSNGGHFATWTVYDYDTGTTRTFGQGFSAGGAGIGSATEIGTSDSVGPATTEVYNAQLCGDGATGVAIWQEEHYNGSSYSYATLGRKILADGSLDATVLTLMASSVNAESVIDARMLEDAGFGLVSRFWNGSAYVVKLHSFDAAGDPMDGSPSTIVTQAQYVYDAFILDDATILLAEYNSGLGQHQIRTVGPTGAALETTLLIGTDVEVMGATRLSEHSYVLTWEDFSSDGNVMGMVVDLEDGPGAVFNLASTSALYQYGPSMARLPDGGFVAVWMSQSVPNGDYDVYGRVFDGNGTAKGVQFLVNTLTDGYQDSARVSVNADGSFQVFWRSSGNDGDDGRIEGQYFDADGRRLNPDRTPEEVTFAGTASNDQILATDAMLGVVVSGEGGNDSLAGGLVADTIYGGTGNDTMDGGQGTDLLAGGAGNDEYLYDGSSDLFIEQEGQGLDRVRVNANSFTLDEFGHLAIEDIVLGSGVSASGNSRNNRLTGNELNNQLDGGAGADTMTGLGGNDTYSVDATGDSVVEQAEAGLDTVVSSIDYDLGANVEALTLVDNLLYPVLTGRGNELDNLLTGSAGASLLAGGAGNDTYVIDSNDTVSEDDSVVGGGGIDKIVTVASVASLATGIENLELTGEANLNGVGNTLANELRGNSGNNSLTGSNGNDTLDGRSGVDTLVGGQGSDVYVVSDNNDVVTEASGQGTDKVSSNGSFTLLAGVSVEILELLGDAASSATGNELANELIGNGANNTLNGGTGNDVMRGGAGDDLYVENALGDSVVELVDEGIDTVQTGIAATLDGNVENLTLTGTASVALTGNDLANVLTGNSGANTLDGKGGADTMKGGTGSDTYVVDDAGDVVEEALNSGTADLVKTALSVHTLATNVEKGELTGTTSLDLYGNTLANTLTGNTLNNKLDGLTGADTMLGGKGDDFYYIDNTSDTVTELAGEGNDTVYITGTLVATYVLKDNFENLVLEGSANLNGTGNFLSNVIYGNTGANIINGGLFADVMIGGLGNDTYVVDNQNDIVVESTSSGTDTVQTSVSYDISSTSSSSSPNVEKITLTGSGNINATGNLLLNTLTGNSGANSLSGGSGNDTLSGGAGNDTLDGGTGVDSMVGGTGDDTYIVDIAGDILVEGVDAGFDTVKSSVTWTLAANFENLFLTGTLAINGTGNTLSNQMFGNNANNILTGGAGDDLLKGADVLTGNTGADTLRGGTGNDVYYIDSTSDRVVELDGEGDADTIYSSVSFTLPDFVEKVFTIDVLALFITGNGLNNFFQGSDGDDSLDGGGGNDNISAGKGKDTLIGGEGADTMLGGEGDDEYFVDEEGDVVTELTNQPATGLPQGTTLDIYASVSDTVNSTINYTLGTNLENLVLAGVTGLTGIGNELRNELKGNSGANLLQGLGDFDTLIGGGGNDTLDGGTGTDIASYAGAAAGVTANLATLSSSGGAGIDTFISIESLIGSALADTLTGNSSANMLDGAAGNDTLNGGSGNDTLIGGAGKDSLNGGLGADVFDFNTLAESAITTSRDVIVDFVAAQGDKIDLSTIDANAALTGNQAFTSLRSLATAFSATNSFGGANAGAGKLYFDQINHVLYANVDADAAAEFSVALTGVPSLLIGNLVL